jgi:molybdopterin molybdotransferase
VTTGAIVLERGTMLGAAQVGALAAAGISEVRCAKRPRVGILVTGSELRPPGQPLGPGEIYESNGLMLAAQLA